MTTPDVSIVDNADGTGATATITNSDVGAMNTVRIARYSGTLVGVHWTDAASRVGDGSVQLPVAFTGLYFAYVNSSRSGQSAVSQVVGVRVSDGIATLKYQCWEAIYDYVAALSLPGIPSENYLMLKFPWRELPDPSVVVSPILSETRESEDNQRDFVSYGFQIALVRKSLQDLKPYGPFKEELRWANILTNAFNQKALVGLEEHIHTVDVVVPDELLIPPAFEDGYDIEAIVVRCETSELT